MKQKLSSLFRNLFMRAGKDRDVDEELESYVGLLAEEKIQAGFDPRTAAREARVELGGKESVKEKIRQFRLGHGFDTLLQDIRFGLRMLRKNPGFTLVAVLTLALGIGANTTVYTFIYAALFQTLPVPEQEELAVIRSVNRAQDGRESFISAADYLDFRRQNRSFAGLAALTGSQFNLSGIESPVRVRGSRVSANFFSVLGVTPALGRAFLPDEEKPGEGAVVILSHGLWERSFGADPDVVGRGCSLNGIPHTIIGVMPSEFWFLSRSTGLWTPLPIDPGGGRRDARRLYVFGRLRHTATRETASEEFDLLASGLAREYPDTNGNWGVRVSGLLDRDANTRAAFVALFGAIGFVLLLACANVANLLLARATHRQKEIAIRTAVGASRYRLVRQAMTESLLIALLGGAIGFLLAWQGVRLMNALSPLINNLAVNGKILAFSMGLSLLSAILFGLVPALKTTKPNLTGVLHSEGGGGESRPGRQRLGRFFVVSEVSMAFMLLLMAGLFIDTLSVVHNLDFGFDTRNLLTFQVSLPETDYREEATVRNFYEQALQRIDSLPGVRQAGAADRIALSLGGASSTQALTLEGRASAGIENSPFSSTLFVSATYFETLGVPILQGRPFASQDSPGSLPAAIINSTLASRYWKSESPVGQRLKLGGPESQQPWLTIVGIADDVRSEISAAPASPVLYLPTSQSPRRDMSVIVRTSDEPSVLFSSIQAEVHGLDSSLALYRVRTMEEIIYEILAGPRLLGGILDGLSLIALFLAVVGVYGVISYSVNRRIREIGIRMALGSRPAHILRLVLGRGMGMVLTGLVVGLVQALGMIWLFSGLLFAMTSNTPVTLTGVALLLTLVGLMACYIPARRAMKVDPMVALRYE